MLAPMAGITDLPFRNLVQSFGRVLVTSEMIASQDMVFARRGTREKAELGLNIADTAVQLAGREPHWMAEAARMAADFGARVIDINMGCPAKKVTGGQSGSALMRDPARALSLIEAVTGAVKVPVTLKMRLGWDEGQLNAAELARAAEDAGVARVVVHGRTRCQFYKGRADWPAIANVVRAVGIPVIANGDIADLASARKALDQSGGAGVMVGRAARGRPWVLAAIAAGLRGEAAACAPTGVALAELVATHYEAMLAFYGTKLGTRVARKQLGWYMDHGQTTRDTRSAILTETDPRRVLALLPAAFEAAPERCAA